MTEERKEQLRFLRSVDLFALLETSDLEAVLDNLDRTRLPRYEVLFSRGDAADALYVILQGRLQAIREPAGGGEPEIVREMGRGEPVGELALLTDEPRSLTVRAARDTELIRLTKEGFTTLVARNPGALLPVMRSLARRLQSPIADGRAATARTVAVLPLEPEARLEPLLPGLMDGLAEAGSVLALDAARFDATHGPGAAATPSDDPRSARLAGWLNAAEVQHDAILYLCDPGPTPWSERCLRQADRVLVVARAGAAPSLHAQAGLLAASPLVRELVLLHASGTRRPAGTAAWLDATGASRHHHLRLDRPADGRRLARFLSGRAVGLALGGGGARGFAHAGILRALAECSVPVDCVGGVSMGSMAAASHAMGWDHEEVVSSFRRAFVDTLPWRYDLPIFSVFSPAQGDRALQRVFGDAQIEDLWTSCFCVAANITRAETKIFRRGPVWQAVRASGSFPGLLPPVPQHGELLVDGGLLVNVPVALMQQLCPGPVIACDVSRDVELEVDRELTLSPSARRYLWGRLRRSRKKVEFPGIASVLMRSLECREVAGKADRRRAAALYLMPPVAPFGLMDITKLDAIVETGYRYTLERLRELPPSFPREARAG